MYRININGTKNVIDVINKNNKVKKLSLHLLQKYMVNQYLIL